jgi:hypothetical protein
MFHMCRGTPQRQDVLLSTQRRQNDKLGFDEFDKLPLPEPPLDEDPFASLSAADLAAMGGAPATATDGSGYEGDEDSDDDEEWTPCSFFPPFWCLDAKGGE